MQALSKTLVNSRFFLNLNRSQLFSRATQKVQSISSQSASSSSSSSSSAGLKADSTNEFLKKIDLQKDLKNLSEIEQIYIKKIINLNNARFEKAKRLKKHQRIAGISIVTFILSVYFYTMLSVRQEKFLDDFDVPEPPDQAGQEYKKQQEAAIIAAKTNPKAHH